EPAFLAGSRVNVHGRDEQPTGPQRTSDLREQRPVQEVEVAHQVVLALDAEAGRLDVCDLPQDPLGDAAFVCHIEHSLHADPGAVDGVHVPSALRAEDGVVCPWLSATVPGGGVVSAPTV